MVDLNRLQISEHARKGLKFGKGMMCLFLLLLVFSFFIGHYVKINFPWDKQIYSVQTMIARKAQPLTVSAFTAGGWIEVATPQYPKKIVARLMNERIEKILVQEGDIVKPGQVVAHLFDKNQKIIMDLTKAELEGAKAELQKMENGYRQEEIEEAQFEVGTLEEQIKIAKINLSRSEKQGANLVSQATLDEQRAEVDIIRARLAKAQAVLALRQNGFRQEEIAKAKADVQKAQANYEQACLNYSFCTVTAPKDIPELTVLKVLAKEGQITSAEDKMGQIMLLYDPEDMQVRADIRQQNIRQVQIGGPVRIKTDTDLFHEYHGTILRIDPEADIAKNTVSVKIKIEDPDEYLFPEMVAQISFLAHESTEEDEENEDEVYEVMLLPATAIHQADDGTFFVWINDNQIARKRAVTIAKKLEGKVEISGGIEAGTRVIISDISLLKDGVNIKEEE